MITPVFIPMSSSEPERCPHCHHILSDGSDLTGKDVLIGVLVIGAGLVLVLWLGFTLMDWAFYDHKTLVQEILDQWHWFVDLLHRIV